MTHTLDLTSLQKSISSLEDALNEYQKDKSNSFVFNSCIQRFEYTYELSWKMLKRYLETTAASQQDIEEMSFPSLIRTGFEKGLLKNGWPEWGAYREARGATSHSYNQEKAKQVFSIIPDFLEEARTLLNHLKNRQSQPE